MQQVASLPIKPHQVRPCLDILYQRYFSHFEIIVEGQQVEETWRAQIDAESGGHDRVCLHIEAPYECKPLGEAKQVQTSRGVALDPAYLD